MGQLRSPLKNDWVPTKVLNHRRIPFEVIHTFIYIFFENCFISKVARSKSKRTEQKWKNCFVIWELIEIWCLLLIFNFLHWHELNVVKAGFTCSQVYLPWPLVRLDKFEELVLKSPAPLHPFLPTAVKSVGLEKLGVVCFCLCTKDSDGLQLLKEDWIVTAKQ